MNSPAMISRFAVCLFGFEAFLLTFRFVDWGQGLARGGLLGLVMLLLLGLRRQRQQIVAGGGSIRVWRRVVLGLVAAAAVWNLSMVGLAIHHTAKTGEIRLDQGQTTYRASLELWQGLSPYRQGALLDPHVYNDRMPKRIAAGLRPTIPDSAVAAELERYWNTLDPAAREALLPAVPRNGPASARLEASVLGYKYGPVPLLLTAILGPRLGPAVVPLLNGAACLAMFVVIALLLDRAGAGLVAGGLALCAIMIDPWITYSYIRGSATDVWPLLFGFAAILSAMCGRYVALGLCLALALGSKLLPAALYLPLLISVRSPHAVLAFGAAAVALFGPWLIWDAHGLFYNFLLWGVLRDADSTSWVYRVAPVISFPIQLLLVMFAAVLAYRLISGRDRRWAWIFAAMTVSAVAVTSAFHNNYIPWFSTWVVMAIAEAFYIRRPLIEPGRMAVQPSRVSLSAPGEI